MLSWLFPHFKLPKQRLIQFLVKFSVDDQASVQHSQAFQRFAQLLVLQSWYIVCVSPSFPGTKNAILEHSNFGNLGKAHIYLHHTEPALLHLLCFLAESWWSLVLPRHCLSWSSEHVSQWHEVTLYNFSVTESLHLKPLL